MKVTLIKAHLKSNRHDGYDPHHHWMVVNVEPETYFKKILGKTIYPSSEWKELILDPYTIPWIRENVKTVGYGYKQQVDPKHVGYYAFWDKHDGIDGQVLSGGAGKYLKDVYGTDNNALGYKPSAEIYEVELDDKQRRFMKLEELPEWFRPVAKWLIDEGILQGTGAGFDLSMDMVRILALVIRIIDKKTASR